jgi:hypothetical protein
MLNERADLGLSTLHSPSRSDRDYGEQVVPRLSTDLSSWDSCPSVPLRAGFVVYIFHTGGLSRPGTFHVPEPIRPPALVSIRAHSWFFTPLSRQTPTQNQHKTNTFLTPPDGSGASSEGTCGSSLVGRTYRSGARAEAHKTRSKPYHFRYKAPGVGGPFTRALSLLLLFRGATEPRGEESVQNPYSTHAQTPLL